MVSLSLVNHLYSVGSLQNQEAGPSYRVKNRLFDAILTGVQDITIDGLDYDPETSELIIDGSTMPLHSISVDNPLPFPLRSKVEVRLTGAPLAEGPHTISRSFVCDPFGPLDFEAVDYVVQPPPERPHIPRTDEDWSQEAVQARQQFVHDVTGVQLQHVSQITYDPGLTQGNIENLTGTAEIPLGIAGPLIVNGEHAKGEFLVPMATTREP